MLLNGKILLIFCVGIKLNNINEEISLENNQRGDKLGMSKLL
jgi:hypothetical protein